MTNDKPCLCRTPAGSMHFPQCPHYPPHGYDEQGVPYTESLIDTATRETETKLSNEFGANWRERFRLSQAEIAKGQDV